MQAKQQWWLRAAFLLPMLAAAMAFVTTNLIIVGRLFYPYEIEWIEGGSLQVVVRILDGLSVYSLPTPDYVAPLYMPLYFYVSALSAKIFGTGLPALRMVSYLAALLSALVASRCVWRITGSRMAALLAIFVWGAMFRFSGTWYDVARVDSLWGLFLIATVAALVAYRYTSGVHCLFLAALSYILAFFTKQSSLALAPFFFLAVWAWAGFAKAFWLSLLAAVIILLVGAVLQWQSGWMFYFFTMDMATTHKFNNGLPANFLIGDLLLSQPILLIFSIVFWFSRAVNWQDFLAWSAIFGGFFLLSMLARWYSGGYFNVLISFHLLWVVMGISGFFVFAMSSVNSSRWFSRVLLIMVVVLFSLNLLLGVLKPAEHIPSAEDRACGDVFVDRLAKVDGRVCISRHGYLAYLAGKSFCAHEAFAVDLTNGSDNLLGKKLKEDTRNRLMGGYYSVLVMDTQAQFNSYDVEFSNLRYTATDLDCPKDAFYPKIVGQRPLHWLQYNGVQMNDLRNSR